MADHGRHQVQYPPQNGLGNTRRTDMLSQVRRTCRPDTDTRPDRGSSSEYILNTVARKFLD